MSTYSPAIGSSAAPPSSLLLTFSERIASKASSGSISIIDNSASTQINIALSSSSVTISNYQVTIDLTGNALGNGKLYHVLIPSGAFTSYASQSYAGISTSTWRFNTTGKR